MRKACTCGVTIATIWMAAAAMAQSLPAEAPATAPATQPAPLVGARSDKPVWAHLNFTQPRILPVQCGGRIMPVDTLARQTVWEVTGQRVWDRLDPMGLFLAWTWFAGESQHAPVVLVGNPDLRRELGLPLDCKHFSYALLSTNSKLRQMIEEIRQEQEHPRGQRPPKWTPLQQAAMDVWQRLSILRAVFDGHVLRFIPSLKDAQGTWVTLADLDKQPDLPAEKQAEIRKDWDRMRTAFAAGDRETFATAGKDLNSTLAGLKAPAWPEENTLVWESLYNLVRPFRAGWIVTFAAMAVGLLAAAWPNRWIKATAWGLLLDGFAALTAGILIRWRFGGNIPVATMYESLIFMGWGVTAIGIITMLLVRQKATLPVVAGVATAILVIADTGPLTADVSPLEPVLRNTAWLTYHVLTVIMAYSAFALAMGVGHVQAASLAFRPDRREWTASLGRLLYGMILVGGVFLTAGIIFGAIWASKSWGRYWGWDPKETWSLITLLGYMVVLHGRRIGWFGPFGLAVAAIVCFLLVVMTYYGVNFVLGTGLHSYGFASGGQIWVGLYAALEVVFVLWMWMAHGKARTAEPTEVAEQAAFRP